MIETFSIFEICCHMSLASMVIKLFRGFRNVFISDCTALI